MKIIACFMVVFYISHIVNFIVNLWQHTELKEEKSTPIYITKVIE